MKKRWVFGLVATAFLLGFAVGQKFVTGDSVRPRSTMREIAQKLPQFVAAESLSVDQTALMQMALANARPCDTSCGKYWESNSWSYYYSNPTLVTLISVDGRTRYTIVPGYESIARDRPRSFEPAYAIYMQNLGPEGVQTMWRLDRHGQMWRNDDGFHWNPSPQSDWEKNYNRVVLPKHLLTLQQR